MFIRGLVVDVKLLASIIQYFDSNSNILTSTLRLDACEVNSNVINLFSDL
jgi:hypothetical protein